MHCGGLLQLDTACPLASITSSTHAACAFHNIYRQHVRYTKTPHMYLSRSNVFLIRLQISRSIAACELVLSAVKTPHERSRTVGFATRDRAYNGNEEFFKRFRYAQHAHLVPRDTCPLSAAKPKSYRRDAHCKALQWHRIILDNGHDLIN